MAKTSKFNIRESLYNAMNIQSKNFFIVQWQLIKQTNKQRKQHKQTLWYRKQEGHQQLLCSNFLSPIWKIELFLHFILESYGVYDRPVEWNIGTRR